ncbi:pilus assembly protein TadG-related protein [Sphingopyxis sp. BSN-002]|uniref:TadG family pilus assembly protein n=1 Tax=Sphingopyxis sp. BSN-002 TaxID=2911495 RepID=UPI001EDBDA4C|nr:TadG family pilus assembly protein [Sphingopyxis sp. BSN-002]UKK84820.1 pilus assembly protein TadG-related protein [Sphingopyxis sp. BSN-002]
MTITHFFRDTRASISIASAAGLTMLIGSAALAVDVGSFYLDRRKLQGIADAAALAAAGRPGEERAAAERIIAANCDCGIAIASLTPGTYTPDAKVVAEQRFAAGGASPNAVRIRLTRDRPMFFGRFLTGREDTMISASATGARRGYAAFSLGSRVAAVHGGVPNALLSALTGSQVNLSVMDYNALASADVDLLAFSEALRTELDADVLTFGQTLDTQATLPQVLSALSKSTTDGRVASAVGRIADTALPRSLFPSRAIDLGPRSSSIRVDPANPVKVNALSLLRSMLLLSNANRQVDMSVASSLPGGSGINVALLIGEPPAQSPLIAVTDNQQVIVRTAQVRLKMETKVATPLATVEIPVFAELGSASARITDIDCRPGSSRAVNLGITASPATLAIGKVSDSDFRNMQRPLDPTAAKLVKLPLASVEAKAELVLSDLNQKPASFSRDDIDRGTVKTVESSGLVAGAAKSLAERMDLKVNILGLGLNAKALTTLVGDTVGLAAPVLDGVLESITGTLGVHIGEADARVNALRCGKAKLV